MEPFCATGSNERVVKVRLRLSQMRRKLRITASKLAEFGFLGVQFSL